MRRWTLFAALLAGCYQPAAEGMCTVSCPSGACPAGLACGSDGFCHKTPGERCGPTDAGGDGSGGRDAAFCYGAGFVHVCLPSLPQNIVTYVATSVDTNDAACDILLPQNASSKLCLYVGGRITFTGTVRVTGPNPVAFLGASEVIVNTGSVLDVASHAATPSPSAPGVATAICGTNLQMNGLADGDATGGGGGAGGSLLVSGGPGGPGASAMNTIAGGISGPVLPSVTTVRAGCPGGRGGNTPGGVGGNGGGAVYLMSGSVVRVLGQINASGAGGGRPSATGGGGGGGTGGFIGLDAPTYELTGASIFAVGGSGAAGATSNQVGVTGNEATGPASPGGTTTTGTGGLGGAGGASAGGANGGGASLGGGGGGGGSTGFIGIANIPAVIPPSTFAPVPVSMN